MLFDVVLNDLEDLSNEQGELSEIELAKCKQLKLLKSESELELRENGIYKWKYHKPAFLDEEPSIKNACRFIDDHNELDHSVEMMISDIIEKCDGSEFVAKNIVIEYMSEIIAFWEVKALERISHDFNCKTV